MLLVLKVLVQIEELWVYGRSTFCIQFAIDFVPSFAAAQLSISVSSKVEPPVLFLFVGLV